MQYKPPRSHFREDLTNAEFKDFKNDDTNIYKGDSGDLRPSIFAG